MTQKFRIVPQKFRGNGKVYYELQYRHGRGPWHHIRDCNTEAEANAEIARRNAGHAQEEGAA